MCHCKSTVEKIRRTPHTVMRGLAVLYIDKGQLKWSMGTGLIHPLDICMMYNLGDLNDPSIRKIKEREKS